jgi:hypothetical protein
MQELQVSIRNIALHRIFGGIGQVTCDTPGSCSGGCRLVYFFEGGRKKVSPIPVLHQVLSGIRDARSRCTYSRDALDKFEFMSNPTSFKTGPTLQHGTNILHFIFVLFESML